MKKFDAWKNRAVVNGYLLNRRGDKAISVYDNGYWDNNKYSKSWHRAHGGAWCPRWVLAIAEIEIIDGTIKSNKISEYKLSDGHAAKSLKNKLAKLSEKQIGKIIKFLSKKSTKIQHVKFYNHDKIGIDELYFYFKNSDEKYHIDIFDLINFIIAPEAGRAKIKNIIDAIRTRLANRKMMQKINIAKKLLQENPQKIFVEFADSIKAGNCVVGTKQLNNIIRQKYNISGDCAVRADIILAIRDDKYSRRACERAAIEHYI